MTVIKCSTCPRLPPDVTESRGRESGRESEWEGTGGADGGRESGSWRAEQNTSVRGAERGDRVRDGLCERSRGRKICC